MYRLILALLIAAPAFAQTTAKPTPSEAAQAFTLDGVAPSVDADPPLAPDTAVSAPDAAAPAAEAPAAVAEAPAAFTLDTPIADLIADPRAKAVLDRDLPGLSDDSNLDKFRALSLRGFQPLTGGQMSDALLAKVGADLAALPSEPAAGAKGRRGGEGR